jgi:hypothetical protein
MTPLKLEVRSMKKPSVENIVAQLNKIVKTLSLIELLTMKTYAL